MNTLLVHGFGQPAILTQDAPLDWETVTWHPEARVNFLDDEDVSEADLSPLLAGDRARKGR